MMVSDLLRYPDQQIAESLRRCREEIKPEKGFVNFNLAIIIEKMGIPNAKEREKVSAEMEWAALMDNFYLCSECPYFHGPSEFSKVKGLSGAGHYALRSIGGPVRIIHTESSELHYVQKMFMEFYALAPAHEYVESNGTRGELTSVGDIMGQLHGKVQP